MTDERVLPRTAGVHKPASMVALVGFMGAGKTTVGQALAQHLGWRFADLDALIEDRAGLRIPEIFSQQGEARFRELECEALEEVVDSEGAEPLVLGLGGGAFVGAKVRDILKNRGIPSVWLHAPADELFRRSEQPEVIRPLRRSLEEFSELYEQRLSSYRLADLHVVTNRKEISSIVEEIIQGLKLAPHSRSGE